MSENEIRFFGDLQKLDVSPDDVFVLTCEDPLSHQTRDVLAKMWKEPWAYIGKTAPALIILDGGIQIGAIGQTPGWPTGWRGNLTWALVGAAIFVLVSWARQ